VKLLLAILSVAFFHLLYVDLPKTRNGMLMGAFLVEYPLWSIATGIPLACMAGSCLGIQTTRKKTVGLIGLVLLQAFCILSIAASEYPGGSFSLSIPFLACSFPLLVMRIRQNPEKEFADRKSKVREERSRVEETRAALAKKSPGSR
jgi:hypothetical protein